MGTRMAKSGSPVQKAKLNLGEIKNASTYDVIIIGAGSAGIGAARYLQKINKSLLKQHGRKINFLVIEARERVGGRCYNSAFEGVSIDWGGKWIHGSCKKNPMRKLLNELRKENGDDLPVDIPKWHRSQIVEKQAIKSKNVKKNRKFTSQMKISSNDRTQSKPESVLPCLRKCSIHESNLGFNWLADFAKSEKEVFDGDCFIGGRNEGRIVKLIAKTMRREMERIVSDLKSNLKKEENEDYDFTIEEALETFFVDSGDILLCDRTNEVIETHVPRIYLKLLEHVLLLYGPTIGCSKTDIESKKYLSLPYFNMIMGLFSIRIYHEFENFEGQRLDVVSAFSGTIEGHLSGGNADVRPGYGKLLELAAKNLFRDNEIILGVKVSEIGIIRATNTSFQIEVTKNSPSNELGANEGSNTINLHCNHIICTLPLGCLKDSITNSFDPEKRNPKYYVKLAENLFPSEVSHAIQGLGVAVMDKVALSFENVWWPDSISILNMISGNESHPTWHVWPSFHIESFLDSNSEGNCMKPMKVLLCYLTGAFAESMESKSDIDVMQNCLQFLRKSFEQDEINIPDPIAFKMTRWKNDPFSRGSWTILPKKANLQMISELRKPIIVGESCTFNFAGEHTCDGIENPALENGTVHGAWVSGELAAERVAQILIADNKLTLERNVDSSDFETDSSDDSGSETFSSSDF